MQESDGLLGKGFWIVLMEMLLGLVQKDSLAAKDCISLDDFHLSWFLGGGDAAQPQRYQSNN